VKPEVFKLNQVNNCSSHTEITMTSYHQGQDLHLDTCVKMMNRDKHKQTLDRAVPTLFFTA